MPVVIDSSIAASWAIPDEDSVTARKALDLTLNDGMLVPQIFWYEFGNVLIINERRQRLRIEETALGLKNVAELAPETDPEPPGENVMTMARKHRLTVYDAAYLELAQRRGAVLATLDTKLAAVAARAGIALIA